MSVRDYHSRPIPWPTVAAGTSPTSGFANALNRGHDDADVNYLTAALSFYSGGPAGADVKAAWDRILDRLGIPREVEQPLPAPPKEVG
jgi:hypothetical protein